MVTTTETEHRPLNILISGAGIGGLTTAIALRQAGHNVQIFERSLFSNEYGAAVNIASNANGLLRGIGLALEDIGGVNATNFNEYAADGRLIKATNTSELAKRFKYPWQYIHRVDLHSGLRELAKETTGKGTPVKIHLGSRTTSVDPSTGTLTLENGDSYQGDVVVAADGVNSALRKFIDHSGITAEHFGMSIYRFLVPTSILFDDPQTKRFVENGDQEVWKGGSKKMVIYPCRGGKTLNCAAFLADNTTDENKAKSGATLKAEMLEQFKDFHPDALALLQKADDVKFWPLFDMQTLDTWANGKAVLLGDAAHPFLPFQGQGAAQAIEDAITLAEMLPIHSTTSSDVPERLKLYQKARLDRVEKIQIYSRIAGRESGEEDKDDIVIWKMANYYFSHDAREYARDLLRQQLEGGHTNC